MRYVIETKGPEAQNWGNTLKRAAERGEIIILQKEDPQVQMERRLEQVADALKMLKAAGYNSNVMKSYLRDTTKMSMKDIDLLMNGQMDFFRQIGAIK